MKVVSHVMICHDILRCRHMISAWKTTPRTSRAFFFPSRCFMEIMDDSWHQAWRGLLEWPAASKNHKTNHGESFWILEDSGLKNGSSWMFTGIYRTQDSNVWGDFGTEHPVVPRFSFGAWEKPQRDAWRCSLYCHVGFSEGCRKPRKTMQKSGRYYCFAAS